MHLVLWFATVVFGLWFAFDVFKWWREKRGTSRANPRPEAVDDMTAAAIISRYIDPDETMRDRVRLHVRIDVLKRFDDVVGARLGDGYNGKLLHQWMQKNAARILVAHRDDIR